MQSFMSPKWPKRIALWVVPRALIHLDAGSSLSNLIVKQLSENMFLGLLCGKASHCPGE